MMMRIGLPILAALLVGSFAFAPAADALSVLKALDKICPNECTLDEESAIAFVNAFVYDGDGADPNVIDVAGNFADFDAAFKHPWEDNNQLLLLSQGSALIVVLDAQFQFGDLIGNESFLSDVAGFGKVGPAVLVVNPLKKDDVDVSHQNMTDNWDPVIDQVGGAIETGAMFSLRAKAVAKSSVKDLLEMANYPQKWSLQIEGDFGPKDLEPPAGSLTFKIRSKRTWNDAFAINGMTLNQPEFGIKLGGDFLFKGDGTYRNEDFALLFEIPADLNPAGMTFAFSSRELGLGSIFKLQTQWNSRMFAPVDSDGSTMGELLGSLEDVFNNLDKIARIKNKRYDTSTASFTSGDPDPEDFTFWYKGPMADDVVDAQLYVNGILKIFGQKFARVNSTMDMNEIQIDAELDATIPATVGDLSLGEVGADGSFMLKLDNRGANLAMVYSLQAGAIGSRQVTINLEDEKLAVDSPPTCLTPFSISKDFPLTASGLPSSFAEILQGTWPAPEPGYLLDCTADIIEGPANDILGGLVDATSLIAEVLFSWLTDEDDEGNQVLEFKKTRTWDDRFVIDIGANAFGEAIAVTKFNRVFRIDADGGRGANFMGPASGPGKKLTRIDLHDGGTAVAVLEDNTLYHLDTDDNWTELERKGRDVGINGDHIWITGVRKRTGGYRLYYSPYSGNGNFEWEYKRGNRGMVRIDAKLDGTARGIDKNLILWRIDENGNATETSTVATDLSVSPFDKTWILNQKIDSDDGGAELYQHRSGYENEENGWAKYQGRYKAISVGGNGFLFAADADGQVSRNKLKKGSASLLAWTELDPLGSALDLDAAYRSGDGLTLWKIGSHGAAKRRVGDGWEQHGNRSDFIRIAAVDRLSNDEEYGSEFEAVALNDGGRVLLKTDSGWARLKSAGKRFTDLTVAGDELYLISDEDDGDGGNKIVYRANLSEARDDGDQELTLEEVNRRLTSIGGRGSVPGFGFNLAPKIVGSNKQGGTFEVEDGNFIRINRPDAGCGDVAAGYRLWCAGKNGKVYTCDDNVFERDRDAEGGGFSGDSAMRIAVAPYAFSDKVWVLTEDGEIYQRDTDWWY